MALGGAVGCVPTDAGKKIGANIVAAGMYGGADEAGREAARRSSGGNYYGRNLGGGVGAVSRPVESFILIKDFSTGKIERLPGTWGMYGSSWFREKYKEGYIVYCNGDPGTTVSWRP